MAAKVSIPYRSEILAAVIVLVFLVMVKNRLTAFNNQMMAINGGHSTIENHKNMISRWHAAADEFSKAISDFLFEDPYAFKRLVEKSAAQYDVEIDTMRLTQDISGKLGKATVTMTIIGSYTAIVEYVKSLEARHVRFSSISTGGGGERKNVSVVLYAYYAKESGA